MRKSTLEFSFWRNPIRWGYNKVFAILPLMWKVKVATLHVSWMMKKQILLDRYLGQRYVSVRYTHCDWQIEKDSYGEYMLREISFVYKRRNIPWALSKEKRGFQCNDYNAFPMLAKDRESATMTLTLIRSQIHAINKQITRLNEQHKTRQAQIEAFKHPTPANHL